MTWRLFNYNQQINVVYVCLCVHSQDQYISLSMAPGPAWVMMKVQICPSGKSAMKTA